MEKRTVLAIGLIIAVIGVWQLVVVPRFAPPPPQEQPVAEAPAPQAAAPAAPEAAPVAPPLPSPAAPVTAAPAERIELDTPLVAAVLANERGGSVESWRLKRFAYGRGIKDEAGTAIDGAPLEMVRPAPGSAPLAFVFTDPATEAAFGGPWALTRQDGAFTLERGDGNGLRVTRTIAPAADGYGLDLAVTIENAGDVARTAAWETAWGPGIDRYLPEKERSQETANALAAGSLEKLKVKKVGDRAELAAATWVALGDRYFEAALVPLEGQLAAFARRPSPAGLEIGVRSDQIALMPGQRVTYAVRAYLGPKDRQLLAAAGPGLERSIDYGWFAWLAIPFLAILKFCHGFLRSWGLAIFALTLLVKGALFPISYKMFRSMRKMQDVAPKVQALKAKFKNDPQGLQRATMDIYREHGVNPMAGCLPMVVQIPVFFALYRVLFNAIELRGAGFLYIPDLSLKDPYYVTPILMGITMLVQQQLTPTGGDPKQAKMMRFMPIIFTAMFINFSSGLVLYFLFSNLLSISEQKLFRVLAARSAPAPAPAPEKRRKKGRQG